MEIVTTSEVVIHGLVTRTNNATEMSTSGKIAPLWQEFDNNVPVDYQHGERVYGVYYDYESDHTGQFNVLAGFNGKKLPVDIELTQIVVPAGKYMVFTRQGAMPQIAIDAWTAVWQYFSDGNAKHERAYSIDYEYYPNGNEIAVHIAIK